MFDSHLHGISRRLARRPVNDAEDFGQRPASGLITAPPGHGLRDEIQIGDVARDVRAENGVTDRIKRDQGALSFYIQRILHDLAFDRVAQCARQRIAV